MRYLIYSAAFLVLFIVFALPQNSYSKDKFQPWVGTYVQKDWNGGLTIEKEGSKLWIEIWRDFKPGEGGRPGEEKYEQVYFAAINGDTAKRLPFRGDMCPQSFTLTEDGVKLTDKCKGEPIVSYFKRIK